MKHKTIADIIHKVHATMPNTAHISNIDRFSLLAPMMPRMPPTIPTTPYNSQPSIDRTKRRADEDDTRLLAAVMNQKENNANATADMTYEYT